MHTFTRRKRRAYEEAQYWDIYYMFISQDAAVAWRRLRDPSTWQSYAKKLYDVFAQPPISQPTEPCPATPTFNPRVIVKAIHRLQHRRATHHNGLQGEHLMYAKDTLAPFLAHLFNRILSEGFPIEWTMHTIIPIHKFGEALDSSNYRTIMIGHV